MRHTTVDVRELKARLSSYVRQVKSGASLVITEHGKPVGQFVPMRTSVEARLRQLAQAHVVAWSGRKFQPRAAKVPLRGSKTVAELLAARASGGTSCSRAGSR